MAGAAAARELNNTAAPRFALATPADDAAIRRLLRENPMRGAVSVAFEREPEYFRGVNLAGAVDQTIVAFGGSHVVCMGRCSLRECWVDGVAQRVGYLAELRLGAAARGRFGIVRDGYRFFHARQRENPADFYFTSIAADNARARRFLESGARGLPHYEFLAEMDTLLVSVPRRPHNAKLRLETARPENIPALLRVLNEQGQRHQLAAVWTVENLRALERHGLPLERFLLAWDGGEVAVCGALWDQRAFRQIVIHGYSSLLAMARPLLNAASPLLDTPRLPRVGSALAHAFLSPLACAEGGEAMLPDFVEAAFAPAAGRGVEFRPLGVPASDPRICALRRRFSTRSWRSRLYRVAWPDSAPAAFTTRDAMFLPEIGLL